MQKIEKRDRVTAPPAPLCLIRSDHTDPGKENYPDGYVFKPGAMVAEFENAVLSLENYEISDVVETSYGYHILLRLPLDPDGLTMDQDSGTGAYMTLRETAANEKFNGDLTGWIDQAKVEWKVPELENIDFNALFDIVPAAAPEG